MSDEEIIKRRLLIDGDGTGDDRRLNMLLKQFLKWTFSKNDSPENNQIIYDRLLAQMAQCEFAAAKTDYTSKMIQEELKNYAKLSDSIEKSIELARNEIEESKRELVLAKQIRRNKMEYDMLAKVIKEQPDRKDTTKQIDALKKDLSELMEKKIKLERKFQKRRNDFTLLMYSIRELQAQLEEDSSSESSDDEELNGLDTMDLSDDEGITVRAEKNSIELADGKSLKKDSPTDENGSKGNMSVDEDAILELSIDKDESDVKMEETVTVP
ncbi:THO complex protein 7 [Bactrocera oleae]|uniref:THO complex protein 7 n=1 Tax=Bactrocera oleae TaxID=104688 RepID=UPI0006B771A6|nr:THO complex protein 7 [Bactrocera oleae]